jgi:hypothetical protein
MFGDLSLCAERLVQCEKVVVVIMLCGFRQLVSGSRGSVFVQNWS